MKQIFLWPNVVDIIRGLDHFELFALTSGFLVIFLGCACLHQIVGIVTTYFRPESQSDDQATYPYPKGGWGLFPLRGAISQPKRRPDTLRPHPVRLIGNLHAGQ